MRKRARGSRYGGRRRKLSRFGYDPLFFYPPFGRSLGEAGGERKLLVSHRGQALWQLLAAIGH
jgi:XTP/dITP diphosphohydrolase